MAISAAKLVYDFNRKLQALISNQAREVSLVDTIALLNEAQERWFENRVLKEEVDSLVRNDLRPFELKRHKLNCSNVDDVVCFAPYPANLYKKKNQTAICTKDCCPDITKEIIIRIVQSDDLNEARKNPYRKADFYFEQLIGDEAGKGLYVYHEGEMDIEHLIIDYYRKPNPIHAPSLSQCPDGNYYDYDGVIINKDSDFEVDTTFAANKVVDIAVLMALRDLNRIDSYQAQLNKILQTETLHTQ